MSAPDYAAVLTVIRPDSLWGMTDNDYSTLTWDDSNADPKPSQDELDDAWPQVESDRKWGAVRAERDRLLAACDWTQVADAPLSASEKQAWADYRQALRDVPQSQDDPDSIVWPESP
ncbi:MAG TPA: tail fiber assembly protein [Acidimicrobiia bacterium]